MVSDVVQGVRDQRWPAWLIVDLCITVAELMDLRYDASAVHRFERTQLLM
jgi:hypothetical protein